MKTLKDIPLLCVLCMLTIGMIPGLLSAQDKTLLDALSDGGDLLIANRVKGEIPLSASSRAWAKARAHAIPMISQFSVPPRVKTLGRSELRVRVLYNEREIGMRLTWKDATVDDSLNAAERFADAVAVCFPATYGYAERLPYLGMGDRDQPVNIWHWKAAWQTDVDKGFQGVAERYANRVPLQSPILYESASAAGSAVAQQDRVSPIENLLAAGFGTLTSTASAGLRAKGVWKKGLMKQGGWQVVLKRPLSPRGSGVDIDVTRGLLPITFATWDGAGSQRNGTKGITRWRFIRFAGQEVPTASLRCVTVAYPQGDIEKGRQLVNTMECIKCHNLPGTPAAKDVGPDLSFTGAIFRIDYLLDSLKHPNQVVVPAPSYFTPATGQSTMPQYPEDVTEQDFRDMATYLRSLQ